MRYELIIYWSKEDQAFLVEVPELPGCMADGATYEEAVANAQTAIAVWIETAISLNRPIPEPKANSPTPASGHKTLHCSLSTSPSSHGLIPHITHIPKISPTMPMLVSRAPID